MTMTMYRLLNPRINDDDFNAYIDKSPPSSRHFSSHSSHTNCFYRHFPAQVCTNTGVECNLVNEQFARLDLLVCISNLKLSGS